MYRIILIDDEPLILAGIASLVNWEEFDCTIVGKATNGTAAFQMIQELAPDIVITDIRMPVMDGLELIQKCQDANCTFSFIVLTNLEEFHLVKQALSLGASDYLVKIELSEEALVSALARAKEASDLKNKKFQPRQAEVFQISPQSVCTNYISQLLLSQNPPSEVPELLTNQLTAPFAALFSVRPINITFQVEEMTDLRSLASQISDILDGILSRYLQIYTLIPYKEHTYMIVGSVKNNLDFADSLKTCCQKISTALKTYFELAAVFGISPQKKDILSLPEALTEASTALEYYYYDSVTPIVFYHGQNYHLSNAKSFNINFLKKDLSASVLQNDSVRLASIFEQIIELFASCKPNKEHATSACINIYTYLYSFFETHDNTYQDIFPYTINIAEQLNHFTSLNDILEWLESFQGNLCRLLSDRKETRTDRIVEQAKRYVNEHYTEKLVLSDIADALNISSGHLSNSFKKYTGTTLSDYIAYVKIEHAKELIDTHQYLIYQISDILGFDNPYYFSKVFKKMTGISPREHENRPKF